MASWFTVERLDEDTWVVSEYRHWEHTHCYLLLGRERALLIDTGLGVAPLAPVVRELTGLPVTAALTHAHWDHIGGLGEFRERLVHESEAPWLSGSFPVPISVVQSNLTLPPHDFPSDFDPKGYALYSGGPTSILSDGQAIDLGDRTVTVLHTPGHSPGHLCFWEEERGALYSGDLLYQGKLDLFYPTTDPAAFLSSVRRVSALPIRTLRPGHHSLGPSPALAGQVLTALEGLDRKGRLVHGQGILEFAAFSCICESGLRSPGGQISSDRKFLLPHTKEVVFGASPARTRALKQRKGPQPLRWGRRISAMKNIILIGMMGCGKTTVGRLLAQALGRELVDTDEAIERREGRSISDIFAQEGEPYFRDLEAALCQELAQRDGLAVACGGGLPLRDACMEGLAPGGVVFWLDRDPGETYDSLDTSGRPLAQAGGRHFCGAMNSAPPLTGAGRTTSFPRLHPRRRQPGPSFKFCSGRRTSYEISHHQRP